MHDRPHQLSDIERLNRLRLIRSDNVGPRTFASLLRHFGDAASALAHLPGLSRRAKPVIRRGLRCSTMRRLCSACVAPWTC